MNIVTQRDLIREVAGRWLHQYRESITRADEYGRQRKNEGDQLAALDPEKASIADVAAIIGNESWTNIRCGECGNKIDWAIVVGSCDGESSCALCRTCISKLTELSAV